MGKFKAAKKGVKLKAAKEGDGRSQGSKRLPDWRSACAQQWQERQEGRDATISKALKNFKPDLCPEKKMK